MPKHKTGGEGAIERKELSEEEKKELMDRRAKGESWLKLATAYGISIDRVRTLVKHIPPPPEGWGRKSQLTDKQKKNILEVLPIKTFPEIAEMYDVPIGAVVHYYRSVVRLQNGHARKRTSKLTDKQKEEILDLVPLKTTGEIAALYNVSIGTISYYLLQVRPEGGWAQRPPPRAKLKAEDIAHARVLRRAGKSLKTIAELYGVSQTAIHRIVKDIKVPPAKWKPTGKLTQEQKEEIVLRRIAGETLASLAAAYGVSSASICKIARRAKLAGGEAKHDKKQEEVIIPLHPTEGDAAQ